MNNLNHRDARQWHAPVPLHLMLWLDDRITTMSMAVKKPWVSKEVDKAFAIVLKLRKSDRPYIWLRGEVKEEDEKKMLQLSVTVEAKGEIASSYVADRMKATYELTVGDFFRTLVQYGFDQYQFADPGDGRDWVFRLRKFLVDHNHLVYFDPEDTALEICSPWWDEVEDGLFKGNPDIGSFWNSKESKERFEAVKRSLAEASL